MKVKVCVLVAILLPVLAAAQQWIEHSADGVFDCRSVHATDMNGDGDIDIIAGIINNDEVVWFENDGTNNLADWTMHLVGSSVIDPFYVYAIDVDGDGDTDVLCADKLGDRIVWWESDGAGNTEVWVEHVVDNAYNSAHCVFAIDVDSDGDVDVLGAAKDDDDVTWWENDGTNNVDNWTEHTVDGAFDGANGIYARDVDDDGDIDILGAASYADDITWWENDGTNNVDNWTEHTIDGAFTGAQYVYAEDMDGDGDIDVLGTCRDDDDVTWWENDGTNNVDNWIEHTVCDDFDWAAGVYASDVDGDGDTDILATAVTGGEVAWWENDGTNNVANWTEHTIDGDFDGAFYVLAMDMDEDGDIDVLGSAVYAQEITLWEQVGPVELPNLFDVTLIAQPMLHVQRGGYFQYDAVIHSLLPTFRYVDIWTVAVLPNGDEYGPVWLIEQLPIAPGGVLFASGLGQQIPGNAPLGSYTYRMYAGRFPYAVVGSDEFDFEIVAGNTAPGNSSTHWRADGVHSAFTHSAVTTKASDNDGLPLQYECSAAYPNPFNPTTTIHVNLPETADLSVAVYNVTGQFVMQLADGEHSAGTHGLVFDASHLASGLFFIRTVVPGELNDVQKVMLVR